MKNAKELERSLKEVDTHWSVVQTSGSFTYCFYAGVKFTEIADMLRGLLVSFKADITDGNIDIVRAALPVIQDFLKPDDEKFFQPETTQDTCTYCHAFGGMYHALGSAYFEDGAGLGISIRDKALQVEYNSADLMVGDVSAKFDIDYCPKCGRKLK